VEGGTWRVEGRQWGVLVVCWIMNRRKQRERRACRLRGIGKMIMGRIIWGEVEDEERVVG
jgi:hypothetical protein